MLLLFKKTLLIVFLSIITYHLTDGHSSGAPPFSCKTMAPGHGATAQTSPPPYNISVVNTDETSGSMRIRLFSISNSVYFSGFLLRDRLSASLGDGSHSSGQFVAVPADSSILNCGNDKASAVTHSTNTKKRSVEVDWQSPPGYEGSVVFVATFVYNYTTFWLNVESLPTQIGARTARREYSPIDQQLSAAVFSVYEGCGVNKNCLSSPDNCVSSNTCNGLVSVSGDSSGYEIEMFSKQARYVAVGFSDDAVMGGDNVFECVSESNGNSVKAYQSWNEPNRKSNRRLEDSNGMNLVNGLYADGVIYCKIRINPVTYALDRKFDLNNEEYFLLLAAGQGSSETRPGISFHDTLYVSSKSRRLLSEVTPETIRDSFYTGCDVTKTCFGVPEGCIDRQNCLAVTSVAVQGQKFIFQMQARGAAYIATGLSEDLKMGDDHNVECIKSNGEVQAYTSWNVPNRKDNIRVGTDGLQLLEGRIENDTLQCKVSYDPRVTAGFKFDEKYYLLLAAGASLSPDKVGYHNLVYQASTKQILIPSSAKSDSFYRGCDRTKSCFGVPDGCISRQSCTTGVAMSSEYGGRYVFHMIAENSPAYVAVALSDDALMGDDVVFECVREDQSGSVIRPYMSWNLGGQKKNKRLRQNYLSLENSSYVDGKLQCAIRLDNAVFTVEGKNYNLATDKYVLLLAAGLSATAAVAGSTGAIGYHDIVRQAAAERRALADVSAIRGASKLLLHLHGSFMVASWIGLASLGVVLARYYKQTWVGGSCCGKDLWFFWHRFFMFMVWLLTIAGVILIYIYTGGIATGPAETHALLGFITAILTFLQPIGAAFRPSPDSSRRPIFNWLHWLMGNAAHIAAIVTIFLAVDLGKAELPKWTDWILVGFVVHYVVVHLILSVSGCLSDKSGGMRVNSIQMKDMNGSGRNIPHQSYERQKDATYSGTRKFIFTLHFLIIVAFTVLLILLIVYAPVT